eukprot:sb/3471168/
MTESALRSSVSETGLISRGETGLKESSGPSPAVTYNIEGILGFKDFNRSQQLYNEVQKLKDQQHQVQLLHQHHPYLTQTNLESKLLPTAISAASHHHQHLQAAARHGSPSKSGRCYLSAPSSLSPSLSLSLSISLSISISLSLFVFFPLFLDFSIIPLVKYLRIVIFVFVFFDVSVAISRSMWQSDYWM